MEIKEALRARIKKLWLKNKMTQEELSQATGLERTFISHIEKGTRNISVLTLVRILSGLTVSLKYFFSTQNF